MTHKNHTLKHIALLFIILFLIQCPVAACNNENKPYNYQSDISPTDENPDDEKEVGFNTIQKAEINIQRAENILDTAQSMSQEEYKETLNYRALDNYRIAESNYNLAESNLDQAQNNLNLEQDPLTIIYRQKLIEQAQKNYHLSNTNYHKAQIQFLIIQYAINNLKQDPQKKANYNQVIDKLAQDNFNLSQANYYQAQENLKQTLENNNIINTQ